MTTPYQTYTMQMHDRFRAIQTLIQSGEGETQDALQTLRTAQYLIECSIQVAAARNQRDFSAALSALRTHVANLGGPCEESGWRRCQDDTICDQTESLLERVAAGHGLTWDDQRFLAEILAQTIAHGRVLAQTVHGRIGTWSQQDDRDAAVAAYWWLLFMLPPERCMGDPITHGASGLANTGQADRHADMPLIVAQQPQD
jgi:hypothetical protein